MISLKPVCWRRERLPSGFSRPENWRQTMTDGASTRLAGRRLIRAAAMWGFCSAIVRSRRPDRALRRLMPGLG
jgi:hypothetical protein